MQKVGCKNPGVETGRDSSTAQRSTTGVTCQLIYHYLFRMTYCITSRRGTSKLLELVPNPFDDINKICSKQQV